MKQLINKLKSDPGINFLMGNQNVEIYLVGGCVRDYYLGKESKDIDIVIRNLSSDIISDVLKQYGKVDQVGESFGVIKYTPKDNWDGEPIDIALPRVDILIDKSLGHQGIKAQFDPSLTIEEDLERRDFTINSIAVSLHTGQIIDPYNGLKDMFKRVIKCTSNKSFIEDPLRMLRAVQFASRFGFIINEETRDLIKEHAEDIKYITGERVLEELDKIYYKGNIADGLGYLRMLGLHEVLFKKITMYPHDKNRIKTREDFYFVVTGNAENFKTILKGDSKTYDGIKAIEKIKERLRDTGENYAQDLYDAIQFSRTIMNSGLLYFDHEELIADFNNGKFPKSVKELAVNGEDIMSFGYKGADIGIMQKVLVRQILDRRVDNTYEDLMAVLKSCKDNNY